MKVSVGNDYFCEMIRLKMVMKYLQCAMTMHIVTDIVADTETIFPLNVHHKLTRNKYIRKNNTFVLTMNK